MRNLIASAVVASALGVAAPASAAVLYSNPALSGAAVSIPNTLGFSYASAAAQSATLTFRLLGIGSVDGQNSYQDNLAVALNAINLFTASFSLNGGGASGILANPAGASFSNYVTGAGTFDGGSVDFSVPVSLLAGNNSFSFAYSAPGASNGGGQSLGDEGFNITNVVLSSAVPEPATWAMMIVGFALVGASMRRRTTTRVSFA
jgi:PEP-CTERM motif